MMILNRARSYLLTTKKVLSDSETAALRRVCKRLMVFDPSDRAYQLANDKKEFGIFRRRNSLMFLVGLENGARAKEILNLRVRDFNMDTHTLFYRGLKGSNDRELPIRTSLSREIRKYLLDFHGKDLFKNLDPEALIFPISYQRFNQLWKEYTPNPDKTAHSMRHWFALDLYLKCKDIRVVQMALGHRQIANTMIYVDFYYSQTTLRQFMWGRPKKQIGE